MFEKMRTALLDKQNLPLLTKVMTPLMALSTREMVGTYVELQAGYFSKNVDILSDLFENVKQERKNDFSTEPDEKTKADFMNACATESITRFFNSEDIEKKECVEFLLFLALNNRKRLDTGKKMHTSVRSILTRNEGYKSQIQELGESDLVAGYLKGKLRLEPEDEAAVRLVYDGASGKTSTRTLGMEIAKKSDPRGWVCGDYTDCCMPFTSGKNQQYLTREDMSYFLISKNDSVGNRDIIAQSVLVYGEDETTITIAIDNIEIANRAVAKGERVIVAEAYQKLKEHLIDTHGAKGKRLSIVIGTSYNDDGGLITGECELRPVEAKPLHGKMRYSDWMYHGSNYVFYDSESQNRDQKYFGLSEDNWPNSRVHSYLRSAFPDREQRRDRERSIQAALSKIASGEPDGEGGMSFPDNYSTVITRNDRQVGYIIAADYLSGDNEDDVVTFEDIYLESDTPQNERVAIFTQYLRDRSFEKNEDIHGLHFSENILKSNPFVMESLRDTYPNAEIARKGNDTVVWFRGDN